MLPSNQGQVPWQQLPSPDSCEKPSEGRGGVLLWPLTAAWGLSGAAPLPLGPSCICSKSPSSLRTTERADPGSRQYCTCFSSNGGRWLPAAARAQAGWPPCVQNASLRLHCSLIFLSLLPPGMLRTELTSAFSKTKGSPWSWPQPPGPQALSENLMGWATHWLHLSWARRISSAIWMFTPSNLFLEGKQITTGIKITPEPAGSKRYPDWKGMLATS